jgi:hypothetical protein
VKLVASSFTGFLCEEWVSPCAKKGSALEKGNYLPDFLLQLPIFRSVQGKPLDRLRNRRITDCPEHIPDLTISQIIMPFQYIRGLAPYPERSIPGRRKEIFPYPPA